LAAAVALLVLFDHAKRSLITEDWPILQRMRARLTIVRDMRKNKILLNFGDCI
jgi:hypothetical protein